MLDSVLVWFRRDLRIEDHAALAEATRRARRVYCAFVLDRDILDLLPRRADRRVAFIHASLTELEGALRRQGGALIVRHARASEEIPRLARELGVDAVFANRDYEPQAKSRDATIESTLARSGIVLELFKDQTVFDGVEVLTQEGRPFTVFTPYRKAWLKRLSDDDVAPHIPVPGRLVATAAIPALPTLHDLAFQAVDLQQANIIPGMRGGKQRIEAFRERIADYAAKRDFPALEATSCLSVHLRFGTISIRNLVLLALSAGAQKGSAGAEAWLSELIWRDFYFMILDRFPRVADSAFKPEFNAVDWESGETAERQFAAWCNGQTGYPLVDAAMRQLNTTGFMHNRLRMVTASFLTKDLGIDWRRGETYFAGQLNDFDLAANNGGWQWAASTGCDAQPYFRIFNPLTQSQRFDPEGRFIRRLIPELENVPDKHLHAPWQMDKPTQEACGTMIGHDYPAPLVDHGTARRLTLERFASARKRHGNA